MLPATLEYLFGIDVDDRKVCIAYSMFAYFILSYASVGGLGIALHRFLYIKVISLINVSLRTFKSYGHNPLQGT